jgi:hypothetical protein
MIRPLRVAAAAPDRLSEELMTALAVHTWYEFKPLFLQVHASLRERGAAHGGEEMLRLRAYDKLQGMVRTGLIEKTGKLYRGKLPALTNFMQSVATLPARKALEPVPCGQ